MKNPFRRRKQAYTTEAAPGLADSMDEGMVNARMGVLYLGSKLKVSNKIITDLLSNGISLGGDLAGVAKLSAEKDLIKAMGKDFKGTIGAFESAAKGTSNPDTSSGLLAKITDWLSGFWTKLKAKLAEVWGNPKNVVTMSKQFLIILAKAILVEAAPFISDAVSFVQGLWKSGDAMITKVVLWVKGAGVELMSGHPKIVADAIQLGFTRSLMDRLFETIKGAGGLAMAGLSFGASAVVKVIVAAAEMVIRFGIRLFETALIEDWIGWCQAHWQIKGSAQCAAVRPDYFARKFRKYSMLSPVIAALVLTSGICGDKMRYIQCYRGADDSGNAEIITQASFDRAVAYMESLKLAAARYQEDAGYSFSSSDPMVASLIKIGAKLAEVHDDQSTGGKVYRAIDMVMRA